MSALRLDGAIRTSHRKRDARSPQQQRDMMAGTAALHGHEIVRVHDSGRSESGKTMDRATLNAVMDRVRSGETDGLIVALADRLGRAPIEEAMAYVRELTGIGKLVIADMGGMPIDLSNAAEESNLVMQLQFARQYWQATAKRTHSSREAAIAAGKYVGPAPVGYLQHKSDGPLKGKLYPSDDAPAMTRAFEIAATSSTLHGALRHLERELPAIKWDLTRVRRQLAKRVYLGESASPPYVNVKAHPALTDPVTFAKAQHPAGERRRSGKYPLSNQVHCGRCGEGMVGGYQTVPGQRWDKTHKRMVNDPDAPARGFRRMRCTACKGSNVINADKLEAHVREVLGEALGDDDYRRSFDVSGVQEAHDAWQAAQRETERWSNMPGERRQQLGAQRYDAGLDLRLDEEASAHERYVSLSKLAGEREDLPKADELHDPAVFERALRAVNRRGRITVAAGRGSVPERVRFVRHRGDH